MLIQLLIFIKLNIQNHSLKALYLNFNVLYKDYNYIFNLINYITNNSTTCMPFISYSPPRCNLPAHRTCKACGFLDSSWRRNIRKWMPVVCSWIS